MNTFYDVHFDDECCRAVETTAAYRIMNGTKNGRFLPDEAVTRSGLEEILRRVIREQDRLVYPDTVAAAASPEEAFLLDVKAFTELLDRFGEKFARKIERVPVINIGPEDLQEVSGKPGVYRWDFKNLIVFGRYPTDQERSMMEKTNERWHRGKSYTFDPETIAGVLDEISGFEVLKENLEVYTLPLVYVGSIYRSSLTSEEELSTAVNIALSDNYSISVSGLVEYQDPYIVLMAKPYGQNDRDVSQWLTHEFGHLVHLNLEKPSSFTHPLLADYLKLRGIDHSADVNLPELAPQEISAEDFRKVRGGEQAARRGHGSSMFYKDPGNRQDLQAQLADFFTKLDDYLTE